MLSIRISLWICLLWYITLSGWTVARADTEVIYGYEDPSQNLVANWDFEEDFADDKSDWFEDDALYEFVDDAHTGKRSIRVFNRTTDRYACISQYFRDLKGNTTYYLSAFIKLLDNSDTDMFYLVRMGGSYRDAENNFARVSPARLNDVRASPNWRHIGGDFTTTDPISQLKFELQVSAQNVVYLIDTVSLVELPYNPKWKQQSDIDIEKYRKNMLTLSLDVPKTIRPYCKVTVELNQKKRHFGIGSSVKNDYFIDDTDFSENYRKFFFKTFEWAVFENSMKWRPMEKYKDSIRFDRVDTALDLLEAYNVSVRGHSILWSLKEANPDWVMPLSGEDLRSEVYRRIDYVTQHFKGRLIQWDVVNEYLHNKFYSVLINDPLMIDKCHLRAYENDPDVQLYLNDYQAMRTGDYTSALADLAYELMSRNIPVHGIGIQSHMRTLPVSPESVQKRLQILTATGLPVTMTEVSIHTENVTLRAWQLEVLLRMAFSNPNVSGFVFWDFSTMPSLGFETDTWGLFDGEDFTPNEAGDVLLKLLRKWRTKATFAPKKRYMEERISAFHGLYEATVYYKDKYVKNITFYLHPGQDMKVNIPFSDEEAEAVYDGDKERCSVWLASESEESDVTNPRNTGRAYSRLVSRRKSAKVTSKDYIKVRNTNK